MPPSPPAPRLKASKNLAHLKPPSNPDAVLAFLAGLGLSPKEVAAAVASNPRILCARIDLSLAPISAELRALDLSPSQIARLAKIAGCYFLCRSVRDRPPLPAALRAPLPRPGSPPPPARSGSAWPPIRPADGRLRWN